MGRVSGKLALVTGAAQGLGAAHAALLAHEGARVLLTDINGDGAAAQAEAINAELGVGTAFAMRHDVTSEADWDAAIAMAADKLGGLSVLVNNAGNDDRVPWDQVTPDYWDDRFAVNVRHQFFAAQSIAPAMAEAGGGAIVNLGSISWMMGAAGLIAYTTAKSAIMGLTKSLARELGPLNIRVNSIAPGMIWTPKQIARANQDDPAKFDRYLDRQCIKEHLEPADVARMALWLASDESRRCSGQTFILDGGVV